MSYSELPHGFIPDIPADLAPTEDIERRLAALERQEAVIRAKELPPMTEQQPAPLGQEQEAAIRERWLISAFPTIAQGRQDARCLLAEIDRLRAALAEEQRRVQGCIQEFHEIDQVLGKALGYPWYKDDPVNFPDATEANGVCTFDQIPVTLAMEAAERLKTANHKGEYLLSLLREDADLMELLQDAILSPDPIRPDDMARIARAIEHSRE